MTDICDSFEAGVAWFAIKSSEFVRVGPKLSVYHVFVLITKLKELFIKKRAALVGRR
jgi:hypothetical protein